MENHPNAKMLLLPFFDVLVRRRDKRGNDRILAHSNIPAACKTTHKVCSGQDAKRHPSKALEPEKKLVQVKSAPGDATQNLHV